MGYKKGGRPKEEQPRNKRLFIRVNDDESKNIQELVDQSSYNTTSEYIREHILNLKAAKNKPTADTLAIKIAVDEIGLCIHNIQSNLGDYNSNDINIILECIIDALSDIEDKL